MFIDLDSTKDNLYIFSYTHWKKRTLLDTPFYANIYKILVYRIRPQNVRGTGFESTDVEIEFHHEEKNKVHCT